MSGALHWGLEAAPVLALSREHERVFATVRGATHGLAPLVPSGLATHGIVGELHSALSCSASGIPRLLHFLWFGGRLPRRLERLTQTWARTHPHWRVCMWDDAALEAVPWLNTPLLRAAANRGQQSDAVRLELLWALGGVYLDVDMQAVGTLDSVVDMAEAILCVSNTHAFELNNAVMCAQPRHPLLAHCILRMRDEAVARATGSAAASPVSSSVDATIADTGPGFLTRAVGAWLARPSMEGAYASHVELHMAAQAIQRYASAHLCVDVPAHTYASAIMPALGAAASHPAPGIPLPLFILPSTVFFPLPHHVPCPLPDVCTSDDALNDAYPATGAHAAPRAPAVVMPYITDATVGVHYWARTWQRADAQLQKL